jgi:pimeloyl-ACP methyl ester carboxylesterase/DNA-binding CsgD family transcriptional regulator
MEKPPVRYVNTEDGVRIAYYSIGSGAPIVVLHPNPSSHLLLEWEVPAFRRFYERVARQARLVRLDYRGSGLSEREVKSLNPANMDADVRAVLDRLELERVAFFTWGFGGALALHFASAWPERVSRLALAEANAVFVNASLNETIARLRDVDAEVQLRTRANLMAGWSDHENAAGLAELIRGSMNAETFRLWRDLILGTDFARSPPVVQAPVLFLHAEDDPLFPLAGAQALASAQPNATMYVLPGAAPITPFTDLNAVALALVFLVGETAVAAGAAHLGPDILSRREAEVLRLIAVGMTNDEIARQLVISASTVSHHVSRILAKTGAGNRTEAAVLAHRQLLT